MWLHQGTNIKIKLRWGKHSTKISGILGCILFIVTLGRIQHSWGYQETYKNSKGKSYYKIWRLWTPVYRYVDQYDGPSSLITLSPTPRVKGASTRIYDEERKTFYQSMGDTQLLKQPVSANNSHRNIYTSTSTNDSAIKTPQEQFSELQYVIKFKNLPLILIILDIWSKVLTITRKWKINVTFWPNENALWRLTGNMA